MRMKFATEDLGRHFVCPIACLCVECRPFQMEPDLSSGHLLVGRGFKATVCLRVSSCLQIDFLSRCSSP